MRPSDVRAALMSAFALNGLSAATPVNVNAVRAHTSPGITPNRAKRDDIVLHNTGVSCGIWATADGSQSVAPSREALHELDWC